MTLLEQFIADYKGQYLDFDRVNGGQCVDVAKKWANLNNKPVIRGNAIVWAKAPGYEWVKYSPNGAPKPGDIIVWGAPIGGYTDEHNQKQYTGHIGVVVSADSQRFTSFDQNWPVGHQRCELITHPYTSVLGWLKVTTELGGTVNQDQKDFEKVFVMYQSIGKRNPESTQVVLDHVAHRKDIFNRMIKEGKDFTAADALSWHEWLVGFLQAEEMRNGVNNALNGQ